MAEGQHTDTYTDTHRSDRQDQSNREDTKGREHREDPSRAYIPSNPTPAQTYPVNEVVIHPTSRRRTEPAREVAGHAR
jgi:hypothetical protein